MSKKQIVEQKRQTDKERDEYDDIEERTGFGTQLEFDTRQAAAHLGLMSFVERKNFSLIPKSPTRGTHINTFVQCKGKEIYFLTAALGQIMAIFSFLEEGGWATFKIHSGQTEESRCLAKIIRPFFEDCEIYPVSKAFTCHMLVAGKGFKRSVVDRLALVSLLETCSSLNAISLEHVCSLIKKQGVISEAEYEKFGRKVDLTSQKMFMDWFDHNVAISKASVQATLEGEVDPYAGYLLPEVGKLLNRLVFRHVSQQDMVRNRQTLQTIMDTPFGAQLKPLFVFVGPPPTSLVMPGSGGGDEVYVRPN